MNNLTIYISIYIVLHVIFIHIIFLIISDHVEYRGTFILSLRMQAKFYVYTWRCD